MPEKTILQEAQEIIYGPRREQYGHPYDDYLRTSALINALFADKLKSPFTPEEAMMIMVLVKLSRQRNKPQRDNLVDAAGYLGCIEEAQKERKRREQKE